MIHTVTPLAGVWIEITKQRLDNNRKLVTPLAGVWIEITIKNGKRYVEACHSPCGSVD